METARAFYAALDRKDMTAAIALLDRDVRWVTPDGLVWAQGPYVGIQALKDYFARIGALMTDFSVEIEELLHCGDRVLAIGREQGTVRATGRRFSAPCAHLLRCSSGQINDLVGFIDTALVKRAFD